MGMLDEVAEPQRPGDLQIQEKLEFGRLLHGKVRGPRTFENPVNVVGSPSDHGFIVCRVCGKTACLHKPRSPIHGREPMSGGQLGMGAAAALAMLPALAVMIVALTLYMRRET